MAIRKDIEDLMASEVQRFREELLTEEELKQIKEDVMAFCIIEIRKFCGEDIFERKNEELKAKGFDREKIKVRLMQNGRKKVVLKKGEMALFFL